MVCDSGSGSDQVAVVCAGFDFRSFKNFADGYFPEACAMGPWSLEDSLVVACDADVGAGERDFTSVVAQLPGRKERTGCEFVKNMRIERGRW